MDICQDEECLNYEKDELNKCNLFKQVGECPTPDYLISDSDAGANVPLDRLVKHPCQALLSKGNLCQSGKETKAYEMMTDSEACITFNLEVYLCTDCAEEAWEAALKTNKEPVAKSPAAMAGSTTRLLVEKKLRLLKERYSNACNGNDHEEGIKLYAQICLLDNMWLDIIRIEGE